MNLKDQIRLADDRRRAVIPVPEWGMDVTLRAPDGVLRSRIRDIVAGSSTDDMDAGAAVLRHAPEIIARSMILPETGELAFDADSEEDLRILAAKNGKVLERLALEVFDLGDFDEKAKEEAGKD
jgi:hypothetical protein